MSKFKTITSVVISVLLVLTVASACFFTYTQNHDGRYSGIYNLTPSDEDWIIEQFGDCEDIEDLMISVIDYARNNFSYDYGKSTILQHFDFNDTVSTSKGICFDFATFFKAVCLVWSEYNNTETSFKVYVVDIMTSISAPRHSYSVVKMANGTNYYLDLTVEVNRKAKGKPKMGFQVFYGSINDYASQYGETVMNLH